MREGSRSKDFEEKNIQIKFRCTNNYHRSAVY